MTRWTLDKDEISKLSPIPIARNNELPLFEVIIGLALLSLFGETKDLPNPELILSQSIAMMHYLPNIKVLFIQYQNGMHLS